MRHRGSVVLIFSLLGQLLLGMGASAAHAADQVPFKGVFVPEISATPIDARFFSLTIHVTGQATHLGRFGSRDGGPNAFAILDTQPTALPPGLPPSMLPSIPPGTSCYTGTFAWTSPNGKDTISGTFAGCLVPTTDPCVLRNVEVFTVTGGEGRFAGASGGGFITEGFGSFCPGGPNYSYFTGTVSRPSKK
jgi:hypothetical protein